MKADSRIKILLVDDLPENLFALEVILINENYLCVKANSGNEALKILLHEQDFAIILIDVQMPEMDGFETVELIRQIDKLENVPIIFLTASMDNSVNIFKGYQTGAVDYMIKPLSPEILKAKVAVFVDLHKKNQELLVQKEELKALYNDVKTQKSLSEYSLRLIEASHDPLFAISQEGKITDINNASIKVTGLPRQKLINTNFFDYFTEPQMASKVYQEVFAKGFVANSPLTIRHTDGKLTQVLFNGSVYKDEHENILGVVIVARDVTAQKRFENELIEAKIKAENATRIAENAVKAKQQFLSNMSHEIRTPMNAIIGFTKVALKTELTLKQKVYLNAIKVSGDALIVLINDILDLAKVDAGKMIFEQVPFKMKQSIKAMLHVFDTKIKEKNLELITQYDTAIPEVLLGDSIRLHQIILNLISNAVKFTNKGQITVNVCLLKEDEDTVTIDFSVSDTGIGISESKINTIFENFQQASNDTSRLYGGTGLGLAIVKQLVEPQGGTITVKSEINKGTTFSFSLSFQKTTIEAEVKSELSEIETEIKNIKVLVVEDIPLNQLLMKTILDDFGFENNIAENGKVAIEKLEKESYDLILMDIQMPIMNGFETTKHIRNTMKSKIPIIALTADVTMVDLEKCKEVGMNDYIAKPVDERILYSKVVSLTGKRKGLKSKETESVSSDESEIKTKKSKCINLDYLKIRTKSNPKLMMEMISLYLQQTPPLLNAMRQSMTDKNWPLLSAVVHKIIPSFYIIGISSQYATMAKKIQDSSQAGQFTEETKGMVNQIDEICVQACEELEIEFINIENTLS